MKTPVWLQLQPQWSTWGNPPRLTGLRLAKATAKRPKTPLGGAVVMHLEVEVPDALFLPLQASVAVSRATALATVTPQIIEEVAS